MSKREVAKMRGAVVEAFIGRYPTAPEEIVLDTQQKARLFDNVYYAAD